MALNILPFKEEEKVFINIVIETMIKGMKQVQEDKHISGTFRELLIIMEISEEEYISSIKSRIKEAKEILDNKTEHVIILDEFDRRLFMHTIVNAYNTPEVHTTLNFLGSYDSFGVIRSVWGKAEEIIRYWDSLQDNVLTSLLNKAFNVKLKLKTNRKKRYGNK